MLSNTKKKERKSLMFNETKALSGNHKNIRIQIMAIAYKNLNYDYKQLDCLDPWIIRWLHGCLSINSK